MYFRSIYNNTNNIYKILEDSKDGFRKGKKSKRKMPFWDEGRSGMPQGSRSLAWLVIDHFEKMFKYPSNLIVIVS